MGRVGCTVALEFLVVTNGKGVNVADTQERTPSVSPARTVKDDRRTAYGWGRLMVVLYAVLALVILIPVFNTTDYQLGTYMDWLAVVVYAVIAVAVAHNGRRMRILGWCMIALGLIGPLVCGLAQNHLSQLALVRNAWNSFGSDYSYLPLAVALIGAIWMWLSNPRRIVELAEQVERPGLSLRSSKITGAKH